MWDTLILNPMVNILLWIYGAVGNNFGLAIILFTVLIRLITYPLTLQQMKSSKTLTDLQKSKQWLDLNKKFKDDKQKLQQEQMKLYQELGINPLAPCLPTVIQLPVIIGLYQAIMRALAVTPLQLFDLSRHIYPFIDAERLLPLNNSFLWMDLSQPERLVLPFLPFGIPILAVLVMGTTYLQAKLTPTPSSGGSDQGAQMSKMMNLYMPIFMGYLALTFSAGLAVYFVTTNLVGIAQYAIQGKLDFKKILPARK